MRDKKINAIIQARMGSVRLPGKVLMEIEGVPILEHIINRLSKVKHINKVIVATSIKENDDVIDFFCDMKKIPCVRGSESNVLSRFGLVAAQYPADNYIRATGDNPMIDIQLIEDMICFFNKNELSYTCYKNYPIGSGIEIFTHKALIESINFADKIFELEHVTPFMYQRMKDRKVEYFVSHIDDSKIRMTIDTERDLLFAKKLFSRLYKKNPFFGILEIKELLLKEPSLGEININIHQKKLEE